MTIRDSINHIDTQLSKVIVPQCRATLRQLHEWTGGLPASTSDAPPSTLRSAHSDPSGPTMTVIEDDTGLWVATVVSAQGDRWRIATESEWEARREGARIVRLVRGDEMPNGPLVPQDEAIAARRRVYGATRQIAREVFNLAHDVGAPTLKPPASHLEARLAFIVWHVNQLKRVSIDKTHGKRVTHLVRLVDELAGICTTYAPAAKSAKRIDVCQAHDKAGGDAKIDVHYRREHLCRWCGDFRKQHGKNPPVKVVILHDRGVKITASILRNNGIKVA